MCGRSISRSAAVTAALSVLASQHEAFTAAQASARTEFAAASPEQQAQVQPIVAAAERAQAAQNALMQHNYDAQRAVLNGSQGERAAEALAGIINELVAADEAFHVAEEGIQQAQFSAFLDSLGISEEEAQAITASRVH